MKLIFSDGSEFIPSRQMALLLYALSQTEGDMQGVEYGTVSIHFAPGKADVKLEKTKGRFSIDKLGNVLA